MKYVIVFVIMVLIIICVSVDFWLGVIVLRVFSMILIDVMFVNLYRVYVEIMMDLFWKI